SMVALHLLQAARMKRFLSALILLCACEIDRPRTSAGQRPVEPPPGARIVETADGLVSALEDERFHGTLFIPNGVHLDLSHKYNLPLREGVTLMGGRSGVEEGASIQTSDLDGPVDATGKHTGYSLFDVSGANVTVQGLRIFGPSRSYDVDLLDVRGFLLKSDRYRNFLIENCELAGWTAAAVDIIGAIVAHTVDEVPAGAPHMSRSEAYQIRVVHNYIHDNVRDGLGYG